MSWTATSKVGDLLGSGRINRFILEIAKESGAANKPQVVGYSQREPSLAGGDEAFGICLGAAGFRLFLVVQFNELQTRLLNPSDGIADAAPKPASIKGTLVC